MTTLPFQSIVNATPVRRQTSAQRRPLGVGKLPHIASAQEIPPASAIAFHSARHAHPAATLRLPRRHRQWHRAADDSHALSPTTTSSATPTTTSPSAASAASAASATASAGITSQRSQLKRFPSGARGRFRQLPANYFRFRITFQLQVTSPLLLLL